MKIKIIFTILLIIIAYLHYLFLFGVDDNSVKSERIAEKSKAKTIIKKKKKIEMKDLKFNSKASIKNKTEKIPEFIYCLPFRPGNSYYVSQTEGRTHKGSSKYAIDFVIPKGAGVHAVRSGKVISTKDVFSESGRTEEYLGKANYIVIKHDDGTHAMYGHLDHKGSKVKTGDSVKVGDHIGYSGNTGFSNGAHLHFAIFKGAGKNYRTFPVIFRTKNSLRDKLEANKRYAASKDCLLRDSLL